ncbi:glycerol-3-phosphate acyltransferase 1, mitochondrial-like [Anneissia japonica]|uniref:glycerol-3-phosphate acyltransferase 1, mitochondrial-like n=1 Tax=Anneissia japonica TaxID=1529436 RepID=UPI001425902B|nr:glycerol-3-phosphate acyltransferase 1, mitochondrial-like [Anneissia japonica]
MMDQNTQPSQIRRGKACSITKPRSPTGPSVMPDIIQQDTKDKPLMDRMEAVYKKWSQSQPGETRISNETIPGKEAWLNKFGELAPRKRKNKGPLYPIALDLVPEVVNFKTKPPPSSENSKDQRPFKGRCCPRCSPLSRKLLFADNIPHMGLSNVLRLPLETRSGVVSYLLPNLSYIAQRSVNHIYPPKEKMIDIVASSNRVQSAIKNSAMSDTEGKCIGLYLFCYNMVLQYKGVPLVFVPMHRSHLDYVLLSFILHNYGVKAPHIAAGDNLNLPIINWFLQSLGAFYIKRKLDREVGKKDLVYRAALHTYIEEVLRSNQSLEFFMEGGRSRSGKSLLPKGGLLSCVVDSYYDGVISDAFIVPASISYEKILDGNFNNEQMGLPKKKETFLMAVRGILDVLKHNYGHVKVDFVQPFSLKEYLESPQVPATPVSDIATSGICKTKVKRAASDTSLYGTDIVVEDTRQLVKGLAEHILYDSVQVYTIMSTNIVAFLLMTKFREGVFFETLVKEFDLLKDEIASREQSIGFTGKSVAVVNHALRLLGDDLIRRESVEVDCTTSPDLLWHVCSKLTLKSHKEKEFISPELSLPKIFQLSYYSNALISVFLMESILANAIVAECGSSQLMFNSCQSQPFSVSKDMLVKKAMQLCDLLQFEFIFAPPCGNLTDVINDTIENLAAKGIIAIKDATAAFKDQRWVRRIAASTGWDSEDSDDEITYQADKETIEVDLSTENKSQLQFLQSILGPLVEGYWLSACNLVRLLDMDVDDNTYLKLVNMHAKERVEKEFAVYNESCAMDTLRNALKVFLHWKVLITYYDAENIKMLQLKEPYRDEGKLSVLIDKIEAFRV